MSAALAAEVMNLRSCDFQQPRTTDRVELRPQLYHNPYRQTKDEIEFAGEMLLWREPEM